MEKVPTITVVFCCPCNDCLFLYLTTHLLLNDFISNLDSKMKRECLNVISPLRFELFHYIQKVVVDLRLIAKLQFHLV